MRLHKTFSVSLAALMIVGQFGWTAAVAAEESPSPDPTPVVTESPSPTPTPTPEATPTPTASPDPNQGSATPAPSASPSPTPAPDKKWSDIGPDGCGGVIPNWVFDTVSRTWVAADKASFSCDMASGYYLSPLYYFDKRIGWYEIIPPAVAASNPSYFISAPNVVHTVLGDLVIGSPDYQVAKSMGLLTDGAGGILVPSAGINGTGPGSTNQVGVNGSGQSWFDLTNLVNVVNMIQSNAVSGDVTAASNTTAGNSSTGAAMVVANLINLLASAWSWSNGNLNFFMRTLCDFNKTCTGDINLNPTLTTAGGGGQLGANKVGIDGTGPDSTNTVDINNPNTLDVNVQNSGDITNSVNVNAQSGDVNGTMNTTLGNVGTGNAMAEVNIINLINSFISSGSSFFGVLNILGNLNGDILFPDGFLNGLVSPSLAPLTSGGNTAAIGGTGPGSENQIGIDNGSSTTVNSTSANAVNNNILTTANSGAANLNANSTVGNVGTGDASTNQSLFNLANSTIFGDNAVLVMVNVLGHWVGKIMTIPGTGGTQAALLTGNASVGVNNTGPDSTNSVNLNGGSDTNVNQNSTGSITNNVSVNAQSGDANLSKNTTVGDVATGNAQANSSAANLFNTVLNVKHWFGVLIINVVGDWTGAVNEDTEAGNVQTAATVAGGKGAPATVTEAASSSLPAVGLLTFVKPLVAGGGTNAVPSSTKVSAGEAKVLTAAAKTDTNNVTAGTKAKNVSFLFIISALVMMVAGALASIDRKLKRR